MDTDHGNVSLDIDNGLAVITIDHPRARNSLTMTMVDRFHDVLDQLERDRSLGAVVVRGAGDHFCAGLDRGVIGIHQLDPATTEAFHRAEHIYATFERLGTLPMPTFAAVRGAAVGAGLNLAMSTDLRVVANDARLIGGFTRLGLHPGGGMFALATRLLGRDAAVALGVLGEEIDGRRATELGFAWSSVDAVDVDATCLALARRCASDPELARTTIRSFRLIADSAGPSWSAAIEVERSAQMWTFRRLGERNAAASEDAHDR